MVNKVFLLGNTGRDPEVRHLDSGLVVARLSLATSETYKKDNQPVTQTEWHNLVFWRHQAEIIEKYVKKGDRLFVEGRLRTRTYEEGGIKKFFTEIQVDNFQMLSPKHVEGAAVDEPKGLTPIPPPNVPDPGGDLPF